MFEFRHEEEVHNRVWNLKIFLTLSKNSLKLNFLANFGASNTRFFVFFIFDNFDQVSSHKTGMSYSAYAFIPNLMVPYLECYDTLATRS